MTASNEILYRVAGRGDVKAIVRAHLASFEGFFLSSLGPRFLGLFYEGLIALEDGILVVALQNNTIVGFAGGTTDQDSFYRRLFLRRKLSFIAAAAAAAIRRPNAMPRLLRARSRANSGTSDASGAYLMTLGVDPVAEGRGIGRKLVKNFQAQLTKLGVQTFNLTTDADDNERTNRFYSQLGLTLNRVIVTPERRRLNEYSGSCTGDVE